MALPLIPTMLVGSYPQPEWLIHRDRLMGSGPPRVRMREVWRAEGVQLADAQDDAVRLVVSDQERAMLSVIGDGEVRRESYFNHFATALDGIDVDNPGTVPGRTGKPTLVPRVTGPIRRSRPVQIAEVAYLRGQTDLPIKVTLPGAFTMARMALDEHYHDEGRLIAAYADVLNQEIRDLVTAGADIIQIDEPHMQAHPELAASYGVEAIDRALDGISVLTIVHVCFGYAYVVKDKPSGYDFLPELDACSADAISIEAAQPNLDPAILGRLPTKRIVLGVLSLGSEDVETPEGIAARLRGALGYVEPERLMAAPDCGMKYLPRTIAYQKIQAMEHGAAIVRKELGG